MTWKVPRTQAEAEAMLARFAQLDGAVARIEAERSRAIGEANQRADAEGAPLIAERDFIVARPAPWWLRAKDKLTGGKRKSIELAGCMIGSRVRPASLAIAGEEKDVIKALIARGLDEELLVTTQRLDKRAVLASLEGVYAAELAALGLSRAGGEEIVFVERTAQAGTLAEVRR